MVEQDRGGSGRPGCRVNAGGRDLPRMVVSGWRWRLILALALLPIAALVPAGPDGPAKVGDAGVSAQEGTPTPPQTTPFPGILAEMHVAMFAKALERREANITRGVSEFAAVEKHFAAGNRIPGWVEVQWSKPTGAELDKVVERLKALKLTIRNVPLGSPAADGACIFTGAPATERVVLAKAY